MENKILIIEDEASIRGFIKINLKKNGFIVIEASSGEEGLELARKENPDVALIDVMLPGIDGYEVSCILRKEFAHMGIIILTARGQDTDKILGLESGADDYVVKPFNPTELTLRIKALIRRSNVNEKYNQLVVECPPFKLDDYSKKLFKNGIEIELTPTEYSLVTVFMKNPGKAFTRDELLNLVWGYNYFGDPKIVDVNIRRLRSKIENSSSSPQFLSTVWGTGYRWNKQ